MKLNKLNQLLEDDEVVKGNWELGPHHKLFYHTQGEDEEINLTTERSFSYILFGDTDAEQIRLIRSTH